MQNRTAIMVFTVLLVLACLYQLSFSFVTGGVEQAARDEAKVKLQNYQDSISPATLTEFEIDSLYRSYENDALASKANEEVYPLLGHTYEYAKKREINRGLDLQGGMNVTLEVSLVDLLKNLAGSNAESDEFTAAIASAKEKQRDSGDDFVTLFAQSYQEQVPDAQLWTVFRTRENKDFIEAETPNDAVIAKIQAEAADAVERTEQLLRKRIDNLGVVQPKIQRLGGERILVELPGIRDKKRAIRILEGTAQLEFWETFDNREMGRTFDAVNNKLRLEVEMAEAKASGETAEAASEPEQPEEQVDGQDTDTADGAPESLEADSNDLDSQNVVTTAEDTTQQQRSPLYEIAIPNVTQQGQQYFYARGAVFLRALEKDTDNVNAVFARKDIMDLFGNDRLALRWGNKPVQFDPSGPEFWELYMIRLTKNGKPDLGGEHITNARVAQGQSGEVTVTLNMDSEGAKIWAKMTADNIDKQIAIVLDDRVYSCPNVEGKIAGGSTEIRGGFDQLEAADLVSVLKVGRLPAKSVIIQSAVVGPSMGAEAIHQGLMSFLLALLIILIYMIFYYNKAGIVADIALLANLFFVMGVLASLGATLTLPGIAGIVLTIGMSVDANVLIYERIREELAEGKGMRLAIVDGYKAAYSSIIDANLTTLLTGIILNVFGSGPIKGFATTLIIGILTSLFSAIFITRLIFEWRMGNKKTINFATRLTEGAFKNVNFAFVARRRVFYFVSAAIIVGGGVSLATRGLDLGVDFTGGWSYTVRFDKAAVATDIEAALTNTLVYPDGEKAEVEVKEFGNSSQVAITTNYLVEDQEGGKTSQIVDSMVFLAVQPFFANPITLEQFVDQDLDQDRGIMASSSVGPTIADDIKVDATLAVIFSLIMIFLYIVGRFRKWQFGLGALIAMLHDVLVVLGLFSIFFNVLPFSMEIDQAFIAAILTVVGYSINDTVVVFDRIREHLGLYKRKQMSEVLDGALNSTLSRTFNTSISTFFVLLMIFIFGGEVIRGFVFALMIGVVVGTYSSLCVATPIVLDFNRKKAEPAKKK